MDDGDGAIGLEIQAAQIVANLTTYNGSAVCPSCGMVIDPVQALYNANLCTGCKTEKYAKKAKGMYA